jgi:hypothetical protein
MSLRLCQWRAANVCLTLLSLAQSSVAQLALKPMPAPPGVTVDFQDIRLLNLSPLALTLWTFVAAESRVTESEGFGLSVAPHFGRPKISRAQRLAVWGAAGAVGAVLAATAPKLPQVEPPPHTLLVVGLGATGGVITGELVWQWLRPDLPTASSDEHVFSLELTAMAVRLERLQTPIALPEVSYAWVPALMGKW